MCFAIGRAARDMREAVGLSQAGAAAVLGITNVHLSRVESGHSRPSWALVERYREAWGVDLYVLAWCRYGDGGRLPPGLRGPARRLAEAWREEIEARIGRESPSPMTPTEPKS